MPDDRVIYLDNHATTRVDPRVMEAMLPYFDEWYANPGSVNHAFGRSVAEQIELARTSIAQSIHASSSEIVFTSGATESNNLAIFGTCLHPRQSRKKVISLTTEHRAVLDPLKRLERYGFEVVLIPVDSQSVHASQTDGRVDIDRLAKAIDDSVALVTVMLANNEIGVIQELQSIASHCRKAGCLLHTDATQAVGKMPICVDQMDVDLLSFSAHKFYGPKGIGGLYVRNRERRIRLDSQMIGGGHQQNRRSGTLNAPGIVGMARALKLCDELCDSEIESTRALRNQFWNRLQGSIGNLVLNGPSLDDRELRLHNNLNCRFPGVEGASLMMQVPRIACSSGSACTSSNPEPSHVLRAIGCDEDEARSSLRFGFGRFNTPEEVEQAADDLTVAYARLRAK